MKFYGGRRQHVRSTKKRNLSREKSFPNLTHGGGKKKIILYSRQRIFPPPSPPPPPTVVFCFPHFPFLSLSLPLFKIKYTLLSLKYIQVHLNITWRSRYFRTAAQAFKRGCGLGAERGREAILPSDEKSMWGARQSK